jgi:hypothetical protein
VDQKIISEYLRRSYFAVDGLWFMVAEEELSFDKAMELDIKVWKILPKIQARKVKEILGIDGRGLDDFLKAIEVKLEAEEYNYTKDRLDSNRAKITVNKCPWYEILKKAKREHIAPRIADDICSLEFRVWLSEFDDNANFKIISSCCKGDSSCVMDFSFA